MSSSWRGRVAKEPTPCGLGVPKRERPESPHFWVDILMQLRLHKALYLKFTLPGITQVENTHSQESGFLGERSGNRVGSRVCLYPLSCPVGTGTSQEPLGSIKCQESDWITFQTTGRSGGLFQKFRKGDCQDCCPRS